MDRTFTLAVQRLAGFPGTVAEWNSLDSASQSVSLLNVVEAIGSLGIGSAHPAVSFLSILSRWTLRLRGAGTRESAMLRLRQKLALQEIVDFDDVAFVHAVRDHPPTFIGTLVLLDTLLAPAIQERQLVTRSYLEDTFRLVLDLLRADPSIRPEDAIYLELVIRKGGFPRDGLTSIASPPELVRAVLEGAGPGRFRSLAFTTECLGRIGDCPKLFSQALHQLLHFAEQDYLVPGDGSQQDHAFPPSLKCSDELVAVYNACLLLRSARFALNPDSLSRLRTSVLASMFYRGQRFDSQAVTIAEQIAEIISSASKRNRHLGPSALEDDWRDTLAWGLEQRGYKVHAEVTETHGCRLDLLVSSFENADPICIELKRLSYARQQREQLAQQLRRYARATDRHLVLVLIKDVPGLVDGEVPNDAIFEDFFFASAPIEISPTTSLWFALLRPGLRLDRDVSVSLVLHDVLE